MENSIYLKIYQKDGRIENFHFEINDVNPVLDVMNHIIKTGASFDTISKEEFAEDCYCKLQKIDIHLDKEYVGDAQGDCIGFMEHYELT